MGVAQREKQPSTRFQVMYGKNRLTSGSPCNTIARRVYDGYLFGLWNDGIFP